MDQPTDGTPCVVDMKDALDRDAAERLFLEQLDRIDRATAFACRRAALLDDAADDFTCWVRFKLIDQDYAIIRKHDPAANFAAFISVVIQRLLLDYRNAQWGKWHASAKAQRLGEVGVTIEAMIVRDGRTIDESMPSLRRRWPDLTRTRVEEIASMLPSRIGRPRAVDIEAAVRAVGADAASVDDGAFETERAQRAEHIGHVVRAAIRNMEEQDRTILRLHFEGKMSVAQISRILGVDQKRLYPRIKRSLSTLRRCLESEGISADDAMEVLKSRDIDLNFGFGVGTAGVRLSLLKDGTSGDEEGQ